MPRLTEGDSIIDGRLHAARQGCEVVAIDHNPTTVEGVRERSAELPLTVSQADPVTFLSDIAFGSGERVPGAAVTERVLDVPGANAVVDLGGVPTAAGRATVMRRVLRADRPNSPQARDSEVATAHALRRAGVSVVVDLRSGAERAKVPAHLFGDSGVQQYNVPLGGDIAVPTQSGPGALSDLYRRMVHTSGKGFVAVLERIAHHRDETVLLHCHGGRDRTGLTSAMLLLLAGVRMPDVLRDQATVGRLMSEEVRRRRERWIAKGRESTHFDQANSGEVLALARALRTIGGGYGDIGRYLIAHGMTSDTLRTVTTILH